MPELDWSSMEIVLAIHAEGSLSGAAKRLRVDQSTMSRRLQALEEALGQPLFARSRRGAHPTALAKELLPLALAMQQSMRQVEHIAAREAGGESVGGHVRIASLETIADHILLPSLPALLKAYPKVSISLLVGASIKDMTQLEADIAIRIVRPKTGELTVRRLSTAGGAVYGRSDYIASRRGAPLETLDWISWDAAHDFLPESRWLRERLGVDATLRCNRMHSIIAAVRAGVGVAILGKKIAESFPELEEIPVEELAAHETTLWLVRPSAHQHNTLIDLVSAWIVGLFDLSTSPSAPF